MKFEKQGRKGLMLVTWHICAKLLSIPVLFLSIFFSLRNLLHQKYKKEGELG
jgi:hypothetical protein